MKKSIIIGLFLVTLGLAQDPEISSSNESPLDIQPLNYESVLPASSVRTLTLNSEEFIPEDALYENNILSKFTPGDMITLNIQIVSSSAKISAVALIVFGQKIQLQEFENNSWLGYYRLPGDIEKGNYFYKLYIKGSPSINIAEKISFSVDYPIGEIRVIGNSRVSENAVMETIGIKPGEFYSELKAEVNRQKIIDLGFFETASFRSYVSENKTILEYSVVENPIISNVDIIGSVEFSKEELLKKLELKPGSLLSNKQLQKDVVVLEKHYRDKDYIFAKILSVERPSSENNYTLIYRVDECKVGTINIEGNAVTQKYVITREMEMKSGDIFNAGKLREDLRRIYNLNYFSNVVPDLQFDEDAKQVDVTVKVEEKKTSSVNFGGGYGQIQGWFGFVDLFLDNIMGSAQSVLLKAQFGEKLTSYQFKYHNPWMWDNKTSFTAKLWSTYGYNYLTGQRELRNGWSSAIGFQRSLYVQETYSYRYEDVFNLSDRAQDYLDRAVGYSIAYDTRDQWMNPTSGQYDVFTMDHSSKLLGGTINTSRYSVQLNRFIPLAEKQVFAARTLYNYQLGDVFPSEQFYVGSDNTVRGYQSIFAKGNERILFNLEYRYIFSDMFVGVLFYDIGQAIHPVYDPLDEDRNFTNHHGWGSGMGFGIRVITPMGPIRLDYGWPQYKEFSDGFLSFNMGHVF